MAKISTYEAGEELWYQDNNEPMVKVRITRVDVSREADKPQKEVYVIEVMGGSGRKHGGVGTNQLFTKEQAMERYNRQSLDRFTKLFC